MISCDKSIESCNYQKQTKPNTGPFKLSFKCFLTGCALSARGPFRVNKKTCILFFCGYYSTSFLHNKNMDKVMEGRQLGNVADLAVHMGFEDGSCDW